MIFPNLETTNPYAIFGERPPPRGESVPGGAAVVGSALLLAETPATADAQPGHGPRRRYRPFRVSSSRDGDETPAASEDQVSSGEMRRRGPDPLPVPLRTRAPNDEFRTSPGTFPRTRPSSSKCPEKSTPWPVLTVDTGHRDVHIVYKIL